MRLMLPSRSACGSGGVAYQTSRSGRAFCATARTTNGVTSNISSVWLLTKSRLRNSAPSTGNCDRPGRPLMACLVWSWISPAIAIEPPEGISSVVSARRGLIEGTVSPLMVIELSFETSDTSVIPRREMRPSVSTIGVKLSEMPNFLNATDGEHGPVPPPAADWQVTPVGIGNSPPAMKVADSPEIAVILGSASVRTTPALSIARMVAWTEGVEPNEVVMLLPETSGWPFAVNGLVLLKVTALLP